MALPRELRIAVDGPIGPQRLHEDTVVINNNGWYRTLTPSCAWPSANEVLFSKLDSGNPDNEIDQIVSEYFRHGLPVTWCVYPWTQPFDLGKRLLSRGATKSRVKAMLISSSLKLDVVDGVQVDRIDPDSDSCFDAYMRILNAGYQLLPTEYAFRQHRYRELICGANPSMILFLGRYKGEVAGCAGMVLKEDSAHITTSTVLRRFQARGVFLSLHATIVRTMRELGIDLASGHANMNSAPWLEHFGGQVVFSYDIYQLDHSAMRD